MIELLRIHALVRTARVLIVIGMAAEFVRTAAYRKAAALASAAAARMDARGAAYRARGK